jgi:hypothetical protein
MTPVLVAGLVVVGYDTVLEQPVVDTGQGWINFNTVLYRGWETGGGLSDKQVEEVYDAVEVLKKSISVSIRTMKLLS